MIWVAMSHSLASMHAFVTHPDLAPSIAKAEGLVELRAWVGISCLLAAYACADSMQNELCRSRAMHVWQIIPRYTKFLPVSPSFLSGSVPDAKH